MDLPRPKIMKCRLLAILIALITNGCLTRGPVPIPVAQHAVPVSSVRDNPPLTKEQKLAFDRYAMLTRAGEKGGYSLGTFVGDYSHTVVFPAGRADRIYFLYDWVIACYQQQEGQIKLVYQFTLQQKTRVVTKERPLSTRPIHTLLDYITKEYETQDGNQPGASYSVLPNGISTAVRGDLMTKRSYVEYEHDDFNSALRIRAVDQNDLGDSESGAEFDTDIDPYTSSALPQNAFYKRYGLPVISIDQSILNGKPQETQPAPSGHKVGILTDTAARLAMARSHTLDGLRCSLFCDTSGDYNAIHFLFGSRDLPFRAGSTTLFPFGRADRVYVCQWTDEFEGGTEQITCSQMKDGQLVQLYQIPLHLTPNPAARPAQIRSLLDYLHAAELVTTVNGVTRAQSFAVTGALTSAEQKDLATAGSYVQYSMDDENGYLDVWPLSDPKTGTLSLPEHLDLTTDPVTNKPIKNYDFYTKYGLPPADGE